MNKTETAIITGANGFLGSHLLKAIRERGIKTIPLHHQKLYDLDSLQATIEKYQPDYIFHFAGYGNHGSQQEEDRIVTANYFATWNLLQASKYIDYKAFVNIATSSMYGHKSQAMSETDNLEPDTFYAASKAGAAYLFRAYAKQYNKNIVNIIPFSVFGEGEADWRLIPLICKSLISVDKLQFTAFPTHDWIYVDNFIDGVLTATDNIDKVRGQMVNIGTGQMRTNLQVVEALEQISGKTVKTEESYKEPPHHSPYWVANIDKLKSLGWKQTVPFEEGLKRTWEYYSKKYEK